MQMFPCVFLQMERTTNIFQQMTKHSVIYEFDSVIVFPQIQPNILISARMFQDEINFFISKLSRTYHHA